MGIGQAMGFSEGWVAGAIISGAYFGDKLSLLSDTTVLASSTAGVEVFTHIRYMLYTTVPSMLIALITPPKHMAQMISHTVFSIPAMPRVATSSSSCGAPVGGSRGC